MNNVRSLFPHTSQGKLYHNHAGTAPLSVPVVQSITSYLRERSEGRLETYPKDVPMIAECRSMAARLIGAESADRIAIMTNTSDALNVVAGGLDWKSGDRLLVGRIEFPANVWPYLNLKRLGVEVDFLPAPGGRIETGQIAAALTGRTRLLAISAVQFLSGFRADMEAIGKLCREKGVVFLVDAIQAIGAIPIDVQQMKIDALAAGGQKWQLAPHGTGMLYVTEELQSRLAQTSLGWLAVEDPWRFSDFDQPLASSARRYEGGTLNIPSLWGYHAALRMLLGQGTTIIAERIRLLTRRLIDQLKSVPSLQFFTPEEDNNRAGIVTFSLPPEADPDRLFHALLKRNLTAAVREGMLRFSPHFYMTEEEMDTTAAMVAEIMRN